MARAGLERAAQQGRLQVPVAQHRGGLAQQRAVDRGEAGPARGGVDPLVQSRRCAPSGTVSTAGPFGRRAGLLGGRRWRAVADQQQPIERIDRLGRLLGAAHEHHGHAVAAQALDRGGQRGGHALDDDDDGSAPADAASRAWRSTTVRPASGSVARKWPGSPDS
jgi:hypothetical protein